MAYSFAFNRKHWERVWRWGARGNPLRNPLLSLLLRLLSSLRLLSLLPFFFPSSHPSSLALPSFFLRFFRFFCFAFGLYLTKNPLLSLQEFAIAIRDTSRRVQPKLEPEEEVWASNWLDDVHLSCSSRFVRSSFGKLFVPCQNHFCSLHATHTHTPAVACSPR